MDLRKLVRLGRYRVVGEIGRGAMGVVFEGEDPLLRRRVALKVIHPLGLSADKHRHDVAVSRFYTEASAAGRLSHPNLMTVFDLGEQIVDGETIYYIAFEYLTGVDLSHLIKGGGVSAPDVAVKLVRQIAEGLACAHRYGIVHRDIKPSNIRVTAGDLVKITDFGLARLPDSSLTVDGAIMGTPQYMSPEQVEGRPVGPTADIFSLTAILYEILTGKKAFEGENIAATVARVVSFNPPPPSVVASGLGTAFDEMIARGLAKKGEERIKSGEEFIALLDAAFARWEGREVPGGSTRPPRPPLALYFDDETLARKTPTLLREAGFDTPVLFKPAPVPSLASSIARRLREGRVALIHYKARIDTEEGGRTVNVVDLLRMVATSVRRGAFVRVAPVFLGSASPDKQREVFRRLAPFGIKTVFFLDPDASAETSVARIVAELGRMEGGWGEMDESLVVAAEPSADDRRKEEMRRLESTARQLMRRKQYQEAIDLLNHALELSPDPAVFIERGDAYYKIDDFMAALRDYREAYRLERATPEAHARIGACCLSLADAAEGEEESRRWFTAGMKSLAEAERGIDTLVERYRDEPERLAPHPYAPILSALREAAVDKDAFEDKPEMGAFVVRALDKAGVGARARLLGAEDDRTEWIDYAALLGGRGRFDEAEEILNDLLPGDPADVGPELNNLAIAMRKAGLVGRAFQVYLTLLDHPVPDREIILKNMRVAGVHHSRALRDEGEFPRALEVYRQIVRHTPGGRELLLMEMADISNAMGEKEDAREYVRQALRLRPSLRDDPRFVRHLKISHGSRDPAPPTGI